MSATNALLERNAERGHDLGAQALGISPALGALVLTCADHRVDPRTSLDWTSERPSFCATLAEE
jgi:hypothetical protein